MENQLISYAYEKFESGAYDKALEAFISVYQKGYEQGWILKNIYNCYMVGNEDKFRETYMLQGADAKIIYDDCLLDFIPYRDGEYFIFDKAKRVFLGIFSVPVLQKMKPNSIFDELEYSSAVLALDWDFREESDIFIKAKERKIYIVCKDAERCISFWKVPELQEYLENVTLFFDFTDLQEFFHKNTAIHLPMIIRGGTQESAILAKIREEEHQYRLTPEGRNIENVLLTIAIPTANRGNLLLKRLENLMSMPYDAEIEFVVSKNCSAAYEEEYKRASEILDARLHYYDHGKDLLGYQNFHHAIEMSCGKYVLLVSDEDDVILSSIEHYLKLLNSNPNISQVRVKGKMNYHDIIVRKQGNSGIEALNLMFLKQNYISGFIVRKKDFTEDEFLMDSEILADNIFYQYYPHECWSAVLSYRGDALEEPVEFISEGESVYGNNYFPAYATYEARLEQLKGMIDFLHFIMRKDIEAAKEGLLRIIGKIAYLLEMSREQKYDCDNYLEIIDHFKFICIHAIESFSFNVNQREELLCFLDYCGEHAIALHNL